MIRVAKCVNLAAAAMLGVLAFAAPAVQAQDTTIDPFAPRHVD